MKDLQERYLDARIVKSCYSCGSPNPTTRDHVPPKAFLDKPFPFLATVPSCEACNCNFSLDEEYVACAIEVAACGSADPTNFERARISRAVIRNARLRRQLEQEFGPAPQLGINPDWGKFSRVFEKVARGLLLYETSIHALDLDVQLKFIPIDDVDAPWRRAVASEPDFLLPEIGSRQFHRWIEDQNDFTVVQPDRFEFSCASLPDHYRIRMLIGNVLLVDAHLRDRAT